MYPSFFSLISTPQPGDLLFAEWRNSAFRPCHYLAVDHASRCAVLAIRGSLEMGDFISDMSAEGVDVCLMGCHGHVHEGMLSAATYAVLFAVDQLLTNC